MLRRRPPTWLILCLLLLLAIGSSGCTVLARPTPTPRPTPTVDAMRVTYRSADYPNYPGDNGLRLARTVPQGRSRALGDIGRYCMRQRIALVALALLLGAALWPLDASAGDLALPLVLNTHGATPTRTATAKPTHTPSPTGTPRPTRTATSTRTLRPTGTDTPRPATPTATPTNTLALATATMTSATATATASWTPLPTSTDTDIPATTTPTATSTLTNTPQTPTHTATPPSGSVSIRLVSHPGGEFVYWSSSGSDEIELFGEARNDSGSIVCCGTIELAMRGDGNAVLATATAYPMLDTLRPGQTAPFRMVFDIAGGRDAMRAARAQFHIPDDWHVAGSDTQTGWELLSHATEVDHWGVRHVTGEARNASGSAGDLEAVATIRGSGAFDGMVMAAQVQDAGEVAASATTTFDVEFLYVFSAYGGYEVVLQDG